ncbi:MAG: ABC transporter permease subunit [Candidatus Tokpelaia sp.]|uniref:ABC transporter permease n=1 Tax=Candidatus Tokpelaia sp. TaxID=2233777 RepID=UPI00123ADDC1|nr:ABC transporter permease subunit [Candidatus Tokpelaia sp.]KAA6206411.1 MAG: ABC transporter permease subunit [Candidatus Tokpelaia sp.]KAA6207174.1 MAG: ABC transporter permease subunit [Candidatus Tokpelaia sp.]KAA6405939.1 ABC transporter permease [Candidatus Tokpelaia sp.]
MDFALMWESLPALLHACIMTMELTFISLFVGLILAVPLGLAAARRRGAAAFMAEIYMFVFRGTPLLVQLFLIYGGLAQFDYIRDSFLWPYLRQAFMCALIGFSLNTAAYTANIFKGAILAVPAGELEAARACGFKLWQQYCYIVWPQAFRMALPAYGNEVLIMLKSTSLASVITVMELTGTAKNLYAETYAPYEIFITAAVLYWVMSFILSLLLRFLERRFNKNYRKRKTGRRSLLP